MIRHRRYHKAAPKLPEGLKGEKLNLHTMSGKHRVLLPSGAKVILAERVTYKKK